MIIQIMVHERLDLVPKRKKKMRDEKEERNSIRESEEIANKKK